MGRRSNTESIAAILNAFVRRRRWVQAELAREVGLKVPGLRKRLNELRESGMPLASESDPPHVVWQVPKGWFPGAVAFESAESFTLLRLLSRMPRSAERDGLIQRILMAVPRTEGAGEIPRAIVPPEVDPQEESYLPLLEEAAAQRRVVRMRYFSASRGTVAWRHASIQRVLPGPPARFLAVCHTDGRLKWFRVANVMRAVEDEAVGFRDAAAPEVERFMRQSVDGFHQGSPPVRCVFVVREQEWRWVERNLPVRPSELEPVPGGQRVTIETAGVLPLARFVAGLGAAARAESAELRLLVEEIARGALARLDEPMDERVQ